MTKFSFGILVSALMFPALAMADWQGAIEVHAGANAPAQNQGRIFAKGAKIRVEMQAQGHDMVILADAKGKSASMLIPAQKMVMEMPAAMTGQKMMACSTDDVDGCLKTKGYKKTGSDNLDGHPCAIFEGDESQGSSKVHQKIWRPTDMKEVYMLKSLIKTPDGHEIVTFVKNIKLGKLEDTLFKVPADYKKMEMPGMGAMHQ